MAKDKDTQKVSIRFYNDREVRAVWSEENQKWFYSVLDVIGAFNMQDDYEKNRNYWKYLKAKLKKESPQVVSATTQLKLKAADGITSREIFMKGIDYSYYYEQED